MLWQIQRLLWVQSSTESREHVVVQPSRLHRVGRVTDFSQSWMVPSVSLPPNQTDPLPRDGTVLSGVRSRPWAWMPWL